MCGNITVFIDEDGNEVDRTNRLQKSTHYVGGIEWDINRNLEVNLEGYIKEFTQLINTNRNKIAKIG